MSASRARGQRSKALNRFRVREGAEDAFEQRWGKSKDEALQSPSPEAPSQASNERGNGSSGARATGAPPGFLGV